MEIFIGIVIIWIIWSIIKDQRKIKKLVDDLSSLRISILKEPEEMLEQLGLLELDIGKELEKNVAKKIKGLMIQKGHNINNYFPSLNDSSLSVVIGGNINLEVTNIFVEIHHDICEQIRKYSQDIA